MESVFWIRGYIIKTVAMRHSRAGGNKTDTIETSPRGVQKFVAALVVSFFGYKPRVRPTPRLKVLYPRNDSS